MKDGQVRFSLQEVLVLSLATQRIAGDCCSDAVVHSQMGSALLPKQLPRISRTHPSLDVIFFGYISAKKTRNYFVHDVWEP